MCLTVLLLTLMGCSERVYPHTNEPSAAAEEGWRRLLARATSGGGTDYDLIAEKRGVLDRFLVWMGEHGPNEDNMRYSQGDKKIAFLLNAYNAAVVAGVLRHRDVQSVMDVSIGLFPSGGAGFFLGQTFRIDAEWVTLYHLEHQYLLGDYEEPLIHAGLNCASAGCPPLRYYTSSRVNEELQDAMRDYLASDQGMRKTETGYALTELFSWYEDHFVDWSHETSLCGYLAQYADEDASAWLTAQAETGCQLTWFEYDWSLNQAPAAP